MKKYLIPIVVTILCLIMAVQMLSLAAYDDSTVDEPIHILSGYTTLTQAHVLFDPEHPFLAKALAAMPLLFIHPHVPHAASHLTPQQAQMSYNTYENANLWGFQMLYTSGNNPDQLLFLTRTVIALLTVGLALAIYFGTKSVFGPASALAALTFIAFEPSFVAHGHLANDDTIASLFFVTTVILFYRYLRRPSWKTIVLTGLSFGLGLLTKYSLLLLGPSFVALLVLWLVFQRQHKNPTVPPIFTRLASNWQRYSAGLLAIFIIAWACIWIGYGSLAIINPSQNPLSIVGLGHAHRIPTAIADVANFAAPAMYIKGAWLLFSPANSGRHGYLLGACYQGGLWYYFPVTWFFKTALPITILFLSTLILWWRKRKQLDFAPIVLLVCIGIYLAFSMQSNINIGFRHALPMYALALIVATYPFSLVDWRKAAYRLQVAVYGWKATVLSYFTGIRTPRDKQKQTANTSPSAQTSDLKPQAANRTFILPALLAISILSVIVTGTLAYPNDLSYYNILAGEPRPIPFISADSNIDWGQSSKALYAYMQQHNISHVAFDNFTGTTVAEARKLPVTPADPSNHNYHGYLALSRSTIIDHLCTKNNDWGWVVDHYQPIAIVGGSVNLYKL